MSSTVFCSPPPCPSSQLAKPGLTIAPARPASPEYLRFPEYFCLESIPLLRSRFHPFRNGWESNLASADTVIRGICSSQTGARLSFEQARIVKIASGDLRSAIKAFEAFSLQYEHALSQFKRGNSVPIDLPAKLITCLNALLNQMEQAADRVQTVVVFCMDNSVRDASPSKQNATKSNSKSAPASSSKSNSDDVISRFVPDGYTWYEELVSAYRLEYGPESPLICSRFCQLLRRAAKWLMTSPTGPSPFTSISFAPNSTSYRRLADSLQYAVDILGGPKW
eukprot:CAMPEP_0184660118 /NCGR_PEP_ID=MMETSP0308-20130426/32527_1 /TAXON_ID=38269 /ORGANISM="Gloeochaete witrockiana, Strain SAG 46.84" /LENGTH=279 /DNA_ID=CAMNT_0027100473 /DNA_START=114 /DNA_END=950 /DNA_ORIENTATION=-